MLNRSNSAQQWLLLEVAKGCESTCKAVDRELLVHKKAREQKRRETASRASICAQVELLRSNRGPCSVLAGFPEIMRMPISSETRAALELLKEVQTKVRQTEDLRNNRQVGADLNALISVLESPVFQSILNIQDSLRELKRQVRQIQVS